MTPPSSSSSPTLSAPAKQPIPTTMTMTMPDPTHDAVRLDYLRSLSELKDTTRPAIVSLTTIAHESAPFAPAIVAAIVERSLSAPATVKLPIMYLIDSILKNLGGAYLQLFSPVIVRVYQDAFLASDERSRHSLLKVLNTWRNPPPPVQGPVFPAQVLDQLDAFVRSVPRPVATGLPAFPSGAAPMFPSIATQPSMLGLMMPAAVSGFMHAPPMSPTTTVISELNLLIEARTARKATNPLDIDNAQKLDALIQLRNLVLTGQIPPDQLLVVRSTVSHLTQEFVAAQQAQGATMTPSIAVPALSLPFAPSSTVSSTSTPPPPFGIPTTASLAGPGAAPLSIANLPASELAALASALLPGLAGSNGLPSPPPSVSGVGQQAGAAEVQVAAMEAKPQYPQISFSTSGLHSDALALIYPRHLSKCSQCGLRFSTAKSTSASGERTSKLDAHMDLHFRMNRKARDAAHSIQSRIWLSTREAWVSNAQEDMSAALAAPSFFASAAAAAAAADDSTASMAGAGGDTSDDGGSELGGGSSPPSSPAKRLVVPTGPSGARQVLACQVCMERFNTGYDVDADDWVIKDAAVVVEGEYYHAKCWRAEKRKRERQAKKRSASAAAMDEVDEAANGGHERAGSGGSVTSGSAVKKLRLSTP